MVRRRVWDILSDLKRQDGTSMTGVAKSGFEPPCADKMWLVERGLVSLIEEIKL